MRTLSMLPGGIYRDGRHHRVARFYPITGAVEMAVASHDHEADSRPDRVSHILASAVEKIGDLPMSPGLAQEMAVGDRIFLMLRLGILINGDEVWLTAVCGHCKKQFDLCVKRSNLCVRGANAHYPNASVDLKGTTVRVRAPVGADQQWLCNHHPAHPSRALLERCVMTVDGEPPNDAFLAGLSTEDQALVEKTLSAMGPEVACAFSVACPECDKAQEIIFDPYRLQGSINDLDAQIHTLAFYYHWSEPQILGITTLRRHRYLTLIEKECGHHV
ncbi:MAG: hypothetical protein HKP58_18840 [Desulfatitalea sp.]|nr:hypothetical protein [Desulfatitalea sp.]NNK02473.1 hypothetical protein [Desulfatitalea sp.]